MSNNVLEIHTEVFKGKGAKMSLTCSQMIPQNVNSWSILEKAYRNTCHIPIISLKFEI